MSGQTFIRDLCRKAISPVLPRRLKAPTPGKKGLNRPFISTNSLIPWVFATPGSTIIFRAKAAVKQTAFCLSAALAPGSAVADNRLEEIIVSAEFYPTSALKTPGSVTIVGEPAIRQRNAEHLEQLLGLAPNVNYATGASRGRFIQIRGIGERSEFIEPVNHSVGVLIDGIDFTGISTVASTLDVQQVEILRGPQGTVYGANALAGLINIVSADPAKDTEASIEASVGNHNSRVLKGAVGGALSGPVGYRLAGQTTSSDGFYTNSPLGRDDTSNIDETTLRAKITRVASAGPGIELTAFYADVDNGYDVFNYESTRTTRSNQPGHDRQETTAFALSADWRLRETLNLEASLSTADSDIEYGYDEDWRSPALCAVEVCTFGPDGYHSAFDNYARNNQNNSLDVRLKSDRPTRHPNWVLGVYYRDQTLALTRTYISGYGPGSDLLFNSSYNTKNIALYGDWTQQLSDTLTLGIGARFEQRDADYSDSGAFGFATDENLWGGKLSLSYQPNDRQMLYGIISRGYKPGGANSNAEIPEGLRGYDTETMLNYEMGLKGIFFDGGLEAQVAAFYQERPDIQTGSAIVDCPGPGQPCSFDDYLTNAADGSNIGLEAQLVFTLSGALSLYSALGLLGTEYGSYINFNHVNANEAAGAGVDMAGREQPHAPAYQFVMGLDATITEALSLNLNVEGKDDFLFSNDHDTRSSSYVLLNTNLTYGVDHWNLSLWGKNLTDKGYQNRAFGTFGNDPRNGYATEAYYQSSDPRTFGLTGRYNF